MSELSKAAELKQQIKSAKKKLDTEVCSIEEQVWVVEQIKCWKKELASEQLKQLNQ